ncbi:hypothetical protein [Serratia rubidaea]|uniref:hypothetical protein n=1 Tax=Serratia rubidaea TaxID=61652 RepID=UPI0024306435|nr:hypothetical protein [Serratia rubidaea]MCR0998669.1 hypothetical protein [Serratia rubidaea]
MNSEKSDKWFFSWVFTNAQGRDLRGSLIHVAKSGQEPEEVITAIYNHVASEFSLPVDGIRAISFNRV